jgi:hypothetical protein
MQVGEEPTPYTLETTNKRSHTLNSHIPLLTAKGHFIIALFLPVKALNLKYLFG